MELRCILAFGCGKCPSIRACKVRLTVGPTGALLTHRDEPSSMLAVGLSWRQALPAIAIGHTVIAVVMVCNGTVGARLHISFPVLNRSSFGFWFSYFSVISRVVLSMFWFGIQTFTGNSTDPKGCTRLNLFVRFPVYRTGKLLENGSLQPPQHNTDVESDMAVNFFPCAKPSPGEFTYHYLR